MDDSESTISNQPQLQESDSELKAPDEELLINELEQFKALINRIGEVGSLDRIGNTNSDIYVQARNEIHDFRNELKMFVDSETLNTIMLGITTKFASHILSYQGSNPTTPQERNILTKSLSRQGIDIPTSTDSKTDLTQQNVTADNTGMTDSGG